MLKHIYDFSIRKNLTSDKRYKNKYIKYYVVIDKIGNFVGVEENKDKQLKSLCPQYPERVTYGNVPNFLVEKGTVIFDKNNKKHQNYLDDLAKASESSPECRIVYDLLLNDSFIENMVEDGFGTSSDLFGFRVDGVYIETAESWRQYFENKYNDFEQSDAEKQKDNEEMVSVITGDIILPVKNTDKISVGGKTTSTGDVIICCDKPAYQSYGLDGALNGSISKEESEVLKNGLEYLLMHNYHKDWNLIHWYDNEINDIADPIGLLVGDDFGLFGDIEDLELYNDDEKDEKLYEWLNGLLHQGKLTQDFSELKNTKYFMLNFKPCSGRIAFSNFKTGNLDTLFENMLQFYNDSSIQKTIWVENNGKYIPKNVIIPIFKLKSILINCINSTVDGNKKFEQADKEFNLVKRQALLQSIINNTQIPYDFTQRAIRKIKIAKSSGKSVPTVLYQIIKVYLNRENRLKGEPNQIMSTLNRDNKNIAYNLGRLLCVYGKIQEAALGNVNASVTDKFYSSASTSPAYVFGRLASSANYHLRKITNKGLAIYYRKLLHEITENIQEFPRTLNLIEQANFSLGFYQQEQAFYQKKENDDTTEIITEVNNDEQ